MAGPLEPAPGNLTPDQIQTLESIWSSLPKASDDTIKNDMTALQKVMDAEPDGSGLLADAYGSLESALYGKRKANLEDASDKIAFALYPQLPAILTPGMAAKLIKISSDINSTKPNLKQDLILLKQLLAQVRKMPSSPQKTNIVAQLKIAIQSITNTIAYKDASILYDAQLSLSTICPN